MAPFLSIQYKYVTNVASSSYGKLRFSVTKSLFITDNSHFIQAASEVNSAVRSVFTDNKKLLLFIIHLSCVSANHIACKEQDHKVTRYCTHSRKATFS